MTIEGLYQWFLASSGICTDTRNLRGGEIYFALKGGHFDGNTFTQEALDKGASLVVIDNPAYKLASKTLLVDNVLATLQNLATHHRTVLKVPLIALTGSNGKTTTKELITRVLAQKFKVVSTEGNLNNHIGVPLTLLKITKDTEFAVIEMGANHQGEIRTLCQIAQPDFGMITNFGKAHLEGFGGIEGVIKGKSEMYHFLIARNGRIFYNADDNKQQELLEGYNNKYGFSFRSSAEVMLTLTSSEPFVTLQFDGDKIESHLSGGYNAFNIAYAIAIGSFFGVSSEEIGRAIKEYFPQNNRSQLIKLKRYSILLDAYNANPSSMEAALRHFASYTKGKGVIFLGDMFELGDEAHTEHTKIANFALELNFALICLVGVNFHKVAKVHPKLFQFSSFEDLEKAFSKLPIPPQAHILIKGSRGMAMERVLDIIQA